MSKAWTWRTGIGRTTKTGGAKWGALMRWIINLQYFREKRAWARGGSVSHSGTRTYPRVARTNNRWQRRALATGESGRNQFPLIQSCVSRMNQGRFNLSPSPDCMVKR